MPTLQKYPDYYLKRRTSDPEYNELYYYVIMSKRYVLESYKKYYGVNFKNEFGMDFFIKRKRILITS